MRYMLIPTALLLMAAVMISCGNSPTNSTAQPDQSLASLQQPIYSAGTTAGPDSTAEVEFGSEHAGSPFPPEEEHDMSMHGADKIVPRTVVIAAGGSITFEVYPFHQVAIYAPGKTPADIEADIESGAATVNDLTVPFFIPDFVIDAPVGRVALSPPLTVDESEWATPPGTFDTPGRYLMTCTTAPHFLDASMVGWIIVK